MHISESFQQLLRVDQESAWCDALFAFGRGLGFDRCLVAIVPKPGMGLEKAYLRSNYPADWRSFYDTRKLVHVDPTVAHCVAHSTSLIWSTGLFRSGPQRVMYEEASGYGLRSRSEEHTSELQSHHDIVCRLLLEKKKKQQKNKDKSKDKNNDEDKEKVRSIA